MSFATLPGSPYQRDALPVVLTPASLSMPLWLSPLSRRSDTKLGGNALMEAKGISGIEGGLSDYRVSNLPQGL